MSTTTGLVVRAPYAISSKSNLPGPKVIHLVHPNVPSKTAWPDPTKPEFHIEICCRPGVPMRNPMLLMREPLPGTDTRTCRLCVRILEGLS
jgi:hypothetical protein